MTNETGGISITAEMIAAGVTELAIYDPHYDLPADKVRDIFCAMLDALLGAMSPPSRSRVPADLL